MQLAVNDKFAPSAAFQDYIFSFCANLFLLQIYDNRRALSRSDNKRHRSCLDARFVLYPEH